jgi:thioredoxin reductase (NADPH)
VVIVGSQHSEECRDVRAFLALNRIPYEWVDGNREPKGVPVLVDVNFASGFAVC